MCESILLRTHIHVYWYLFQNQDRRPVRFSLPKTLNDKWRNHIGGERKKKYRYDVSVSILHQADTTRDEFPSRWKRFITAGKRSKNPSKFWDELFRRLCDAGFSRKEGDWTRSKVEFVKWIVTGKHLTLPQVQ